MTYKVICQGIPNSPASFHIKHFLCSSHTNLTFLSLGLYAFFVLSTWNITLAPTFNCLQSLTTPPLPNAVASSLVSNTLRAPRLS